MTYRPRIENVTITDTDCAQHSTRTFPTFHGMDLQLVPTICTGLIQHFNVHDEGGRKVGELMRYSSHQSDRVEWKTYPVTKTGARLSTDLHWPQLHPTRLEALVSLLQARVDNREVAA